MRGRPPGGKSSSSDYEKTTLYVRRDLKLEIQRRQLGTKDDLSDFINQALETVMGTNNQLLPLVGSVAGGLPILAEENIESYIAVPAAVAGKAAYALQVKGSSMEPTIPDGSYVLVRPQPTAELGEVVVALWDDEGTVKRLAREGGQIIFKPDNRDCPIIPGTDATIIGKVVATIQRPASLLR